MLIQTKALVIKENNVGEVDRLVTLLTEKAGVIRAFARGARSSKSKTLSATRLFCYSSMTVWASADKYVIREAEPIEVFFEHGALFAYNYALMALSLAVNNSVNI